jgi:hypothetical protein
MAEQPPSRLEQVSEWSYRVDTAISLLSQVRWRTALTILIAFGAPALTAWRHVPGWAVPLVGLAGLTLGVFLLLGVMLVMERIRPGQRRKQFAQRRERPTEERPSDEPMGILASYYMQLTLLKEQVDQMIRIERLSDDEPVNLNYHPLEVRLDKLRRELMNLSPSVFPTATAFDFRPASIQSSDVKQRLPAAINYLMQHVLRHWHKYYDLSVGSPTG